MIQGFLCLMILLLSLKIWRTMQLLSGLQGYGKIPESINKYSVMLSNTSKIVSHIPATNYTWPTIAQESMLYGGDSVAREATSNDEQERKVVDGKALALNDDVIKSAKSSLDTTSVQEKPIPLGPVKDNPAWTPRGVHAIRTLLLCHLLVVMPSYGSVDSSDHGVSGTTVPIDDPSCLADRLFRYRHFRSDT